MKIILKVKVNNNINDCDSHLVFCSLLIFKVELKDPYGHLIIVNLNCRVYRAVAQF